MAQRERVVPLIVAFVLFLLLLGTIALRHSPEQIVSASREPQAASPIPALEPETTTNEGLSPASNTFRPELRAHDEARPEEPEGLAVEGDTDFQRRLVAGSHFRRMKKEYDVVWRSVLKDPGGSPADESDAQPPEGVQELSSMQVHELSLGLRPVLRDLGSLFRHLLTLDARNPSRDPFWLRERKAASPEPFKNYGVYRWGSFLRAVTNPPADLEALRIVAPSPGGDELGRDLLVRVWVRRQAYGDDRLSRQEIAAAEWLSRHLIAFTGANLNNGFDVLVTPALGGDVFPHKLERPRAAGLYYPSDGFCALKTQLEPSFRALALKHELIHAFCFQFTQGFGRAPMICEGLAEYLRYLAPGDQGLRVPVERIGNDLAFLVELLKRLREKIAIEQLSPAKLLQLPGGGFYDLHWFGYLLAEATMAYIGPEAIEAAFLTRSDAPIAAAVERMSWSEFVAFVEEHARDGNPGLASPVLDAGSPTGVASPPGRTEKKRDLEAIFKDLGIEIPPGVALDSEIFAYTPEELPSGQGANGGILEAICKGEGQIFFMTDLSAEMEKPFSLTGSANRIDAVRELLGKIRQLATRKTPLLARLAETPQTIGDAFRAENLQYTALSLPDWLHSRRAGPANLVVCTSSRDVAAREILSSATGLEPHRVPLNKLAAYYRKLFQKHSLEFRAVLVVDLAGGESDAAALARGIAASQFYPGRFAYWSPRGSLGHD